jgi:hypothetical protein
MGMAIRIYANHDDPFSVGTVVGVDGRLYPDTAQYRMTMATDGGSKPRLGLLGRRPRDQAGQGDDYTGLSAPVGSVGLLGGGFKRGCVPGLRVGRS